MMANVLHVRYQGRSFDLPLTQLDVPRVADERDVRMAVARHLEVGLDRLEGYVLERHANGNLTLRPEAVYG
jgi:hypothetical protein